MIAPKLGYDMGFFMLANVERVRLDEKIISLLVRWFHVKSAKFLIFDRKRKWI